MRFRPVAAHLTADAMRQAGQLYATAAQDAAEPLERSSQGCHEGCHDAMPWLRYYWGVRTRAYRKLEQRMGTVTGKGSKSARVLAAVERRIGPFRIIDIEQECPNVSRDMIRLVLRDLRDKGTLRAEGTGRGARWVKTAP